MANKKTELKIGVENEDGTIAFLDVEVKSKASAEAWLKKNAEAGERYHVLRLSGTYAVMPVNKSMLQRVDD